MSDYTETTTITTVKQAIDGFLLSCKVEGRSYGTIDCYADKLKGFRWYATNYNWPDDVSAITTQHLRILSVNQRKQRQNLKNTVTM